MAALQRELQLPEGSTSPPSTATKSYTLPLLAGGMLLLFVLQYLCWRLAHTAILAVCFLLTDAAFSLLLWVICHRLQHSRQALQAGEARLRDDGERFAQLLEANNSSVLLCALQDDGALGQVLEANCLAEWYSGYTREALCRLSPAALLPEERQGDLGRLAEDLALRGQAYVDTVLLSPEGLRLPVELFARRVASGQSRLAYVFMHNISDRQHVETELREMRNAYRALQSLLPLALISLDGEGKVLSWNPAAERLLGWREHEVCGGAFPGIPPVACEAFRELQAHVQRQETVSNFPLQYQRKDGAILDSSVTAFALLNAREESIGSLLLFADLSRQQQLEATLSHVKRFELVRGAMRKAIYAALDEAALLREVTSTLVTAGGYFQAWVGFIDDSATKSIRPSAWVGAGTEYLSALVIPITDEKPGVDPVVSAVRESHPVQVNDMPGALLKVRWLSEVLDHGAGAMLALPLIQGWHACGVVVVSTSAPALIADEEISLLSDLCDDIMVGVNALRTLARLQGAEQALIEADHAWKRTFDAVGDSMCLLDADGNFARCNRTALAIFGKSLRELLGSHACSFLHNSFIPPDHCAMLRAMQSGQVEEETISWHERWFDITVEPIHDAGGQFQGAIHVMKDITERKRAEEEYQQNYHRLQTLINETISAIGKIAEMRDPYTAGHEMRVSHLACAIAAEMGMDAGHIEGLRVAGLLHDIGKLYVPAEILSKSGMLTQAEFNVIKAHPQAGSEILKTINFPWPIAAMVRQHHERLDGSGYPDGITAPDILLEARILAVADVVESMASHRPYRPSHGLPIALQEITRHVGTHFDPAVVAVCVRLFEEQGYVLAEQQQVAIAR